MRFPTFALVAMALVITQTLYSQDKIIVLKGGTIIDVDNYGMSAHDIKNAVIIIENGKIKAVSDAKKTTIPAGAQVIDVSGKFLVPGLIEGFGSVTNQSFANAYLAMGVTTVVTAEDNRRGKTFLTANPSPDLYKQDAYWGADRVQVDERRYKNINYRNNAQVEHEIDSMAKGGAKIMLVHYGVKPEQLPAIISACRRHNIPTVGELGFTRYEEAVNAGIQSFVHTSRYTADILPDSVRTAYSNAPFGPPARYYYSYVADKDLLSSSRLRALAALYSSHHVGLMPTASLLVYPYMSFAKNPWKEPAAALLDEKDIFHEPLDKETGKPKNTDTIRFKAAPFLFSMDSLFARQGAHYITGSGATVFGTLPGVSLHTELESLSHMGLTNRQVIAAATNNFSLIWGWKHIGKIEAGREADLLVLSADPLESIGNLKKIDFVVTNGRIIERSRLLIKP